MKLSTLVLCAASLQGMMQASVLAAEGKKNTPVTEGAALKDAQERERVNAEAKFFHDAGMKVATTDINAPWELFLDSFAKKYDPSGNAHIQLIAAPQPADWNDRQYGLYRTSYYGDVMPKWGASFAPNTGSSYSQVYGLFLQSIVLPQPNPADQAEADRARTAWERCDTGRQNRYTQSGDNWTAFDRKQQGLPPARRIPYDVWFTRFEGPQLKVWDDKCSGLAQTYNSWFNKATKGNAEVADAIMQYNSGMRRNVLVPGTTDTYQSVWGYTIPQSLDDFIKASDAATTPIFTQDYDKSSGYYRSTESHWGASASYGWFFHGGGGGSSSTLDTHSDVFQLHLTIKGLATFDLRPDGWYSQALVQMFGNQPFQPNSQFERLRQVGALYGESGLFNLRAARFLVAYQPSIKVTMDSHSYHEAKSSWGGSGSIGIGPFSFGASAGGSSTDISWDDKTNTLTVTNSTKIPQIIAVFTDVLPDFK